jgi:hypothetical protein
MDIKALKAKLQTHIKENGVPSVKQSLEPDYDSYADTCYVHAVMASNEFKSEYDDFLRSVRGES